MVLEVRFLLTGVDQEVRFLVPTRMWGMKRTKEAVREVAKISQIQAN